jgi:type I restriction enzyme S subunit
LRFPGFEGEWVSSSLGEKGNPYNGLSGKSATDFGEGSQFITYKSIFDNSRVDIHRNGLVNITDREREKGTQNQVRKGDIFFTVSSETPDEVGMSSVLLDDVDDCYLNSFCFGYRLADDNVRPEFLRFYLRSPKIRRKIAILAQGSTRFNISKDEIMNMPIRLPFVKEQEKLAEFLNLIEERIALQNKVIERYESLIRAIILRSQSSSSNRKVYLREILNERKELNEHSYDICSVSVSKGVVNQVEYLGRSFAAKETAHYHVVHKGDIVYTKSPTGEFPYGIIKQSYLDSLVAVSPLYGVYKPIDYPTGVYLHHFFCSPQNAKNYLHKLIQKGAKNTINITNQHFLDNYISMPDSDILQSIVVIIETLSMRGDLEKELLSVYSKQKAFLMSNLFI